MNYENVTQNCKLLTLIAAGQWTSWDMRPLEQIAGFRWIGIAVSNRGQLIVRLTKTGQAALEEFKASPWMAPG